MKISYKEKEELVKSLITVKVVELILSGSFKNSEQLINSAESYFKNQYALGNTYDKLITSYTITDVFTRFIIDLPNMEQYLKDNALPSLELLVKPNTEQKMEQKSLEETEALRKKYFPQLFKHFRNKGESYEDAINSTIEYIKEKNPDGLGDVIIYPETVKVVLADTFYGTLQKMKDDPFKIITALMKNLSKEELQQLMKNCQAYLNNG